MKHLLWTLLSLMICLTGYGAEKMIQKTYALQGEVTGISTSGSFSVKVVYDSPTPILDAIANQDGLDVLQVELKKGILSISTKKHNKSKLRFGEFTFHCPSPLTSMQINGSGSLKASEMGKADQKLNLSINGSGDIKIEKAQALSSTALINGSGDIELGKLVTNGASTVKISGSGEIEIDEAEAGSIEIGINGSGDINIDKCTATETANVSINGSGDITLKSLQANNIGAYIGGSGDIEIKALTGQQVKAATNGSGEIELYGTTQTANYTVSGSGDINASSLIAKEITAAVNPKSSGMIYCNSSATIDKQGKVKNIIAR